VEKVEQQKNSSIFVTKNSIFSFLSKVDAQLESLNSYLKTNISLFGAHLHFTSAEIKIVEKKQV